MSPLYLIRTKNGINNAKGEQNNAREIFKSEYCMWQYLTFQSVQRVLQWKKERAFYSSFWILFLFIKLTCNGDRGIISSFLVGQISSNAMMASLQNFSPITSSSSRPYLGWERKEKRRKKNYCNIFFFHY